MSGLARQSFSDRMSTLLVEILGEAGIGGAYPDNMY